MSILYSKDFKTSCGHYPDAVFVFEDDINSNTLLGNACVRKHCESIGIPVVLCTKPKVIKPLPNNRESIRLLYVALTKVIDAYDAGKTIILCRTRIGKSLIDLEELNPSAFDIITSTLKDLDSNY